MLTPEAAASLAQAGPVAILLVGIAALAWAFIKGYVVPGWLYRQERDARLAAEAATLEAVATLKEVTVTVQKARDDRLRKAGG